MKAFSENCTVAFADHITLVLLDLGQRGFSEV